MFDLGHFRVPLAVASTLLVVCTLLAAECTAYWQLLLAQGIGAGIACGIIYGPATAVVAHWFARRRSTALGIATTGSSIGGTVFPIMFRNLVVSVGFKWSMRIFGLLLVLTLGVANLTLRRRLPPRRAPGGLLNLTMLTYIDASAPSQGVIGSLSFYLVSIANASSGVGRIAGGRLSDRIGPLTLIIPATALAGILTYAWPFVHGRGPLVAISVFYGAASGVYGGLLAAPMMAFGATTDVGRRTGLFMTIMSLGSLAGPPISGAINEASGGFKAVGIYAGQ
ncbi:MFS general substrate transporter [Auriscalpium vulgare]|uniref:MFS general substrate transporter n=1 Tax=Auriscalpium vulgare TaxID=40419 RepID=A0ACB8S3D3_9AGAM|nr:MFS general substrate transporter [Auriscalpium vulgare]